MEEVLDHISKELMEKESKKLLRNLGFNDDDPQIAILGKLEDIPWLNVKKELELLGRSDIVKYIKEKTLITKSKIHFFRRNPSKRFKRLKSVACARENS